MDIAVIGARGIPGVEGGAEKNAEKLFPLVAEKHDVTAYTIGKYTTVDEYRGIRIVTAPHFRIFRTDKLPCYVFAAMRCLVRRPDVIHCQGLGSALLLFLYKLVGRRVVVRYASADYEMKKWSAVGRLGFLFCEWQLRFADAVLAVTPALKRRLIDRGCTARIEVIPNALDEAVLPDAPEVDAVLARYGLERGTFVLGVGRVTAQKNFAFLVDAYKRLDRGVGGKVGPLVIAGGDDGSGYFEELAEKAGSRVIFTGRIPREDVYAFLASCGVYVSSSVHEGMSNSILEAVSIGAPTLVSDIVENRDLPIDARHFFRSDDEVQLAERMADALAERERFVVPKGPFADWRQVADMTLELYDSLFARKQPRSRRPKTGGVQEATRSR